MTIGEELQALAQDYIAGRVELAELDEWLASHAQEIAQSEGSDPAARLSGIIEVTLAEVDAGHASEADLRSRVESYLKSTTADTNVRRVAS
jgi:hypothetical protein